MSADDNQNDARSGDQNEKIEGDPAVAASSSQKSDNMGGSVIARLDNKVDVFCDSPMPLYNSGVNKAYRASSKDGSKSLVAIVCERHIMPRRSMTDVYRSIDDPMMVALFASGVVFWPLTKKEHFVFIYEDSLGKPILKAGDKAGLGWRAEDVMSALVQPMVKLLMGFRDRGFVHGAIRAENMYDGGAVAQPPRIVLGDCLSAPVSCTQPVLYETRHRGMADPLSRGLGTMGSDLYALGVSIAVLMRSNDPMRGLSDDEIIERKITIGSYAAVTGKDRFKGDILELLRGLLHDEDSQRWTIEEVMSWMDGRRLSPKQAMPRKKAPRPMALDEERYLIVPVMAMDLEKHSKAAKRVIEDGSLQLWIERSLEDEEMALRYEGLIADAPPHAGIGDPAVQLSVLSMVLDPEAPLRYKGMSVMGDGVGPALAEVAMLKKPFGPVVDLFNKSLLFQWLSYQNSTQYDITALFNKFEKAKRFIKTEKSGGGVERLIYFLSADVPCLSDVLTNYYVTSAEELLVAFEAVCKAGKAPTRFLDRHVVAFLYERDQKIIEPYIYDVNMDEPYRMVAADLHALAMIQRRYSLGAMPEIGKVMAPRLGILLKRFHDRKIHETLNKDIENFKKTGDLAKMSAALQNADLVKSDHIGFMTAMREYEIIEKERKILDEGMGNKEMFEVDSGRQIAAIVSVVASSVLILFVLLMFFSGKTFF